MTDRPQHLPPLVPVTETQIRDLSLIRKRFNELIFEIMSTDRFDLAKVYPQTDNLAELYDQLSDLRKCLDSFRPFDPAQATNLREVWDTQYTYDSNAIEGNSLTLRETAMVLHEGITIGGKPLKDHLEAVNHDSALKLIWKLAEGDAEFTEQNLLTIHELILHGIDATNAGYYRRGNVRIAGSNRIFPNYTKVPELMANYFQFYEDNKDKLHPVAIAAHLHQKLVNIHPFIDGNGRTARLVMNLHLLNSGYPITIISSEREQRQAYYDALEGFEAGEDTEPFECEIAKAVKHWLFEYLAMLSANGSEHAKDKGYYFFKKIEPFLNQDKN